MNIYRNVFSEVKDYFDNEGFIEFFTDIINGKLPASIDPKGDLVPKILSSLRNKFPKETQQRFNKDGFIDFLKKKRRALAKAFANKHGLDEKNTDSVLDFYLSSISGSFPVNAASVNSYNKKRSKNIKFEDIKRDLKDLGMIALFKSVYKKNDKNGGEVELINSDIQKSLKFFYELPGGEDPTSSSFKIFNKSNNSDITPEMYANIKNVIDPLYNLWNSKFKDTYSMIVKNKKPGMFDKSRTLEKEKKPGFENQIQETIDIEQEFEHNFAKESSIPVSREEESKAVGVEFKDQFENVLNVGDLFFIPEVKKAFILENWIKLAIEQDVANNRSEVWEEYGFPSYSSPKVTDIQKDEIKETPVAYPKSPVQESEKPEEKEDIYLRDNTFSITKKFMRGNPLLREHKPLVERLKEEILKKENESEEEKKRREERTQENIRIRNENEKRKQREKEDIALMEKERKEQIPWIEGVNTRNKSYIVRVPVYLVSKIPGPFKETQPSKREQNYLIPPKKFSEELHNELSEEIFIHEAIYESLLDLIKEAQDDPMEKPSQKVLSEGKVKAINPETNEEMSLTKENNTIKVTPVAKEGDPSSSEYYDQNSPETQELDNTLKAIR